MSKRDKYEKNSRKQIIKYDYKIDCLNFEN